LDVVDRNPDGISTELVAQLMGHGMTAERARQVEARAMRKLEIAKLVGDAIEDVELPKHARLRVLYPATTDTGSVSLRIVIDVDRPEDMKAKRLRK
jgi:hypothetical protein